MELHEVSRKPQKYSYTTAEDLAAMASGMREVAASISCPTALRPRLLNAADKIGEFLDCRFPFAKKQMEAAIRDVQGDIDAESVRQDRLNDLYGRMDEARNCDNPAAWRAAMLETLPLLSDDQIRNLAEIVDSTGRLVDAIEAARKVDDIPINADGQVAQEWVLEVIAAARRLGESQLNSDCHDEQEAEVVFIHPEHEVCQ